MATVLQIEGLTKSIHGHPILSDVQFKAQTGRIVGLLGPNGAGKTTTLRIAVQLMHADQGTVKVNDLDVTKDFTAAIKQVGALIEAPDFYTYLTGRQNLRQLANMSHQTISAADIDRVLAEVGLTEAADKKVRTYSLGMRQRLGIAQAIFHQPELLLLDEPLNGLDPQGAHDLREVLRQMAAKGVAVVISSHMLSEIDQVADDLVVMDHGRVIFDDTMRALKQAQSRRVMLRTPNEAAAKQVLTAMSLTYDYHDGEFAISWPQEKGPVLPLAQALFDQRILITELHEVDASLEESFLNFVKQHDAGAAQTTKEATHA
ncbi:ABC transporter ATP-binding protein [Lapidilactobacillus achengensis]|uniref:ABC transporter ATP-binding protein n=1 Tax=Lapidilactobacillus achengensis TaxID=2486000 RepID=A0ABW1ULP7_9LACO|nr:ABC transporter ATP-binding protein [Lapidilactobacillus achengensis]